MPVHASTIEILTDKANFEPKVAVAIAAAMDNAIQQSQLVTVPILDGRLAELRRDIDVRFADFRREIEARLAKLQRDIETRFTDFRKEVDERFRVFDDRLNEMRRTLEEKIGNLEKRIGALEERIGTLEEKMADSKIQTIRWMVGLMFAQTATLIGIVTLMR